MAQKLNFFHQPEHFDILLNSSKQQPQHFSMNFIKFVVRPTYTTHLNINIDRLYIHKECEAEQRIKIYIYRKRIEL